MYINAKNLENWTEQKKLIITNNIGNIILTNMTSKSRYSFILYGNN